MLQLVGIYEVLKDTEMREAYDKVLVEGLPTWRNPVYYYRRYRKLDIWQVSVIVLVIVSVGQYLAGWAGYWEKKLSVVRVGTINDEFHPSSGKAQSKLWFLFLFLERKS